MNNIEIDNRKTLKVIESCKTEKQLSSAKKYVELFCKMYGKEFQSFYKAGIDYQKSLINKI